MEIFANPDTWISLLTLTFMEVVLGIDNIVFISIIVARLPQEQQGKGRTIGLMLALVFRVILLLFYQLHRAGQRAVVYAGASVYR